MMAIGSAAPDPSWLRRSDGRVSPLRVTLVAESPPMREVRRLVRKVAGYKTSVLIQGESGTGKERVARLLHELAPWSGAPFVAVSLAAVPEALLESELFGHRKGAFTDAHRDR